MTFSSLFENCAKLSSGNANLEQSKRYDGYLQYHHLHYYDRKLSTLHVFFSVDINTVFQNQPLRRVFRKRRSENIQQIYN